MKHLYWNDIKEGSIIPRKEKYLTLMEFNRFAAANDEFYMYHMDPEYDKKLGWPEVIIMGHLRMSYMSKLLEDWVGIDGQIKKIGCQHRGVDVRNSTIYVGGKVINKYEENGQLLLDCELWVDNEKGERTSPGWATVELLYKKESK